ncbi:GNAT family N-acetyltransferase [Pseudomonas viridiflava]|uniref:GNAT family N-acetyltransferase n=1 Tax=Pseudomonas viridiflava TaxID=33069 RepID=UPI0004737291|nr:GNAT family N-acetyltransferase [Pseudomonas viridiflava]
MAVEIVELDPDAAELIAKQLLTQDIGGKFQRVLDRSGLLDEACILFKDVTSYIGFASITADGAECEVYRFFIVPSKRGCGLGTEAAQKLENLLHTYEYHTLCYQIDDERAFRFWDSAVGPLFSRNPMSNMYTKQLSQKPI